MLVLSFTCAHNCPARGLFTLPPELQALAAITAFAEVGRGYLRAEHDLQHWMTTVAGEANRDDACTEGQALNQYYTPSLTYRVDAAGDY